MLIKILCLHTLCYMITTKSLHITILLFMWGMLATTLSWGNVFKMVPVLWTEAFCLQFCSYSICFFNLISPNYSSLVITLLWSPQVGCLFWKHLVKYCCSPQESSLYYGIHSVAPGHLYFLYNFFFMLLNTTQCNAQLIVCCYWISLTALNRSRWTIVQWHKFHGPAL